MLKIEGIINFIKDTQGFRFDKEVAEYLGMDNRTLATYKSRGELPQHYIRKLCTIYGFAISDLKMFIKNIDNYNNKTQESKKRIINNLGDKEMNMNHMEELITLQKYKIKTQEEQIEQLKQNTYPIQNSSFKEIVADMESFVEMGFFPANRTILQFEGHEKLSKKLGIDVAPFLDIGTMYDHSDHPIEKIITKDTNLLIKENMKVLPRMFEVMKKFLTEHYMTIPVTYVFEKRIVHTVVYSKINWHKKVTVHCKTVFMNHDNNTGNA
tara:strand:+ start:916 stop:1716 length:801 start_codon:yes stop_codon:yes gene_type:complete